MSGKYYSDEEEGRQYFVVSGTTTTQRELSGKPLTAADDEAQGTYETAKPRVIKTRYVVRER